MGAPKHLPNEIIVAGKRYRLVVFKVHNKYETGDPEDCTMIPDNQGVEIVGDEQFMTAYVPEVMLSKG